MRHLVQKQEFEITTTSLQTAQQWEHRATGMLRDVITPVMDTCFSRMSSPGTIRIVDRLEIDLGTLHHNISEEEIRMIVTQELMKTLDSTPSAKQKQETGNAHGPDGNKVMSSSEAGIVSFIYFLLHGLLPWWAADKPVSGTWSRTGDSVEWLDKLTGQQLAHLKTILYNNSVARQRLVRQFSDELIISVIRIAGTDRHEDIVSTWKWLQDISSVRDSHFQCVRSEFWLHWISKAVGKNEKPYAFLDALLKFIKHNKDACEKIADLVEDREGASNVRPSRNVVINVLLLEELRSLAAGEDILKSTTGFRKNSTHRDPSRETSDIHQNKIDPAKKDITPELKKLLQEDSHIHEAIEKKLRHAHSEESTQPFKNTKPSDISEIFTEDAGLVILHPFLLELFKSLELLDAQKQWASPASQQTAVLLLGWIARGKTDIPEYELIVPKLFCGMPWEEVLDTSLVLNETHIHTATQLLEAVIGHWSAVGKISPDGLREGFINRQGKLTSRKNGWLITVEKRAQDVLLARLPWGYSMIQFPWSKNALIHVDWA